METRTILKVERKMPTPLETSGRPVEYINRVGNKVWAWRYEIEDVA